MNEDAIVAFITTAFEGVETQTGMGAAFFFYGDERMMPMMTVVTSDEHDTASDLNRPGVFRLNIGVSKGTFESLFGPVPKGGSPYDAIEGFNYTALDTVMPHPVYGRMHWVCVLNPSEATFEAKVKPLLVEAYGMAVRKGERRGASRES
jgi:Family of unknown function (DUF6194)